MFKSYFGTDYKAVHPSPPASRVGRSPRQVLRGVRNLRWLWLCAPLTRRSAGLRLPAELRYRPDEAADPPGQGVERGGGGRVDDHVAGDWCHRLVSALITHHE